MANHFRPTLKKWSNIKKSSSDYSAGKILKNSVAYMHEKSKSVSLSQLESSSIIKLYLLFRLNKSSLLIRFPDSRTIRNDHLYQPFHKIKFLLQEHKVVCLSVCIILEELETNVRFLFFFSLEIPDSSNFKGKDPLVSLFRCTQKCCSTWKLLFVH